MRELVIMTRKDKDIAVFKTKQGSTVTLRFREEDNPELEDRITDNLLMSYERRIKERAKNCDLLADF